MLVWAGIGRANPVPVDFYALRRRSPAALMWVSLAGPLSNFLMAVVAAAPFRLGLVAQADIYGAGVINLAKFLDQFVIINLSLMLFNLIPLAPLDGEKVLEYFLPHEMARSFEQIRPYGPIILMALLFVGPLVGINVLRYIISYPAFFLHNLLIG